jgi:hypothetical protein
MCGQLVLYVGQTINPTRREYEHRRTRNGTGTDDIPKDMEWEMKILEECSVLDKKEKERYWYDTLKPFYNIIRPYTRPKLWYPKKAAERLA